jgi:hypothetical protein
VVQHESRRTDCQGEVAPIYAAHLRGELRLSTALSLAGISGVSWEEWWTYDGISGKVRSRNSTTHCVSSIFAFQCVYVIKFRNKATSSPCIDVDQFIDYIATYRAVAMQRHGRFWVTAR